MREMEWTVDVKISVIEDLRWFGRKDGRILLKEASRILSVDPLAETRNLETLRPSRFAQRELRLFGRYRVLFDVDEATQEVRILVVGEKRGDALLMRGEAFTLHHEDYPPE